MKFDLFAGNSMLSSVSLDALHFHSEIFIFHSLSCTFLSYQGYDYLILTIQVFRGACLSKILDRMSLYYFTKPPRSSAGFCTLSDSIIFFLNDDRSIFLSSDSRTLWAPV